MILIKKRLKRIGIICIVLVACVGAGFLLYTGQYYHADDKVVEFMKTDGSIDVHFANDHVVFMPKNGVVNKGLIFYPGGKVEHTSYAPLMRKIAEKGYVCVLVKMPFNLAVFDSNVANDIISEYNDIEHWYLSGHSLGGAMAANYGSKNPELIDGLILLGAYPASDLSEYNFGVLSLYGSEDYIMNADNFNKGKGYMPETYTEIRIEGGNHAQFGNYGHQEGDGTATISTEKQQEITSQEIHLFIEGTSSKDI